MRTLGNHVEFYALRSIKTDEELTCNYGPTHHEGENACAVRPPAGDSCNLLLFIGP